MAETVAKLKEWLDSLPYDVEIGIDDGGLTLQVIDDPTMPHAPGCAKHATGTAECTCWKTAYYELGGIPEGTEGQDRENYTDAQDRENYS